MDNFYRKINCLDIGTFIALFYIVLVFSSKWPMKEVATIKKCYMKKVFLKIPQNSQETPPQESLGQFQSLRPTILSKKRLWYRCFPLNFAKFLRTLFDRTPPGWLLLHEYNTRGKRQDLSINQENILTQLQENLINNIKLSMKGLRDENINLKVIFIKRLQDKN